MLDIDIDDRLDIVIPIRFIDLIVCLIAPMVDGYDISILPIKNIHLSSISTNRYVLSCLYVTLIDIVPYNHFPTILRCDDEPHGSDEALEFCEDLIWISDPTEICLRIFGSHDLSLSAFIIIVHHTLSN